MNKHRLLIEYLIDDADKRPDKTAIIYNNDKVTYKEFLDNVLKYHSYLNTHLNKKDIVGVQLSNSLNFVYTMFACSLLGTALIPIDKTTPEEKAKLQFKNLNVEDIINDEMISMIESYNDSTVNVSPDEDNSNRPFIISLTSGSTGQPKSIVLTQNNKINRAEKHIELFSLDENDVILSSTPLYHSLAERLVIMSVMLGATCAIMDDFSPYKWLNTINNNKVTFTICDSYQLSQVSLLLSSPYIPEISSLKAVVSSSSSLENHIKKELIRRLDCNLYEIYGTSETSTITCIDLKNDNKTSSVGKPLDCTYIKINNPDDNNIGEIYCKSSLMFDGYYLNDELTKSSFVGEYFNTGDLGKIDDDGYLYYCGRKDDLIKKHGINIYPVNIENVIFNIPDTLECSVFRYHDSIDDNLIAVAVVLKENSSIDEQYIIDYCKKSLPAISVPEKVFIVKSLPKNSMGKIQRNKIYEQIIRNRMTGESDNG